MRHLPIWILTSLALSSAAFAQEKESSRNLGAGGAPQYPTAAALEYQSYRPRNIDVLELYGVAKDLLGREVVVLESGTNLPVKRPNVAMLGDMLLLCDLPESLQRNYALLERLDAEYGVASGSPKSEQRGTTLEYSPRFLGREQVFQALETFRRGFEGGANITFVEGRNMLVMRDLPARIDEMKALLERIDVSSPQAMLMCYLVTPSPEAAKGPALPDELVAGLRNLTGYAHYEQRAIGMVRSAVRAEGMVEISLEPKREASDLRAPDQSTDYRLALSPSAYDADSQTLTLSRCELTRISNPQGSQSRVFSTSTSIVGDEFTVLGGAGSTPLFVVLRARVQ